MQKSTFIFIAVLLAIANVQASKLKLQNAPVNCSRLQQDLEYVYQGHVALQRELEQIAPLDTQGSSQKHQLVAIKNLLTNQQQKGDSCDYYFQFELGLVYENTCQKYLNLERAYQQDPAKVVAQACSQVTYSEPVLLHRRIAQSGENRDLACLYAQLLEQTEVFLNVGDEFRSQRCHATNSFIAEKQAAVDCNRIHFEVEVLQKVIPVLQGFIDHFAPLRQQGHNLVQGKNLRTNINKRLGKNILLSQQEDQFEHLCDFYGRFQLGTVFDEACARYRQLEQRLFQNPAEVLSNACNQITFNDPVLSGRELPSDLEVRNGVCLATSIVELYRVFQDSIQSLQSQKCH